jgi:predicted AAA+ superfamily ATPase
MQITGPAGSGKTFGIKQLVKKYPGQVYYVNCDGKPLSYAG